MRMNMHTRLSVHTFEHGYTHTHTHRVCECASECVPMCLSMGMCVLVSCVFYFRYTSGDCLIDIVSRLWECLSHR